jgi:hypothetical protein
MLRGDMIREYRELRQLMPRIVGGVHAAAQQAMSARARDFNPADIAKKTIMTRSVIFLITPRH